MTNLKTLAAAALVTVAGSAAFAGSSYIIPGGVQSLNSTATIDLVRSATDGTVSVYNYHGGERGALLGTETVHAGANTDVKVQLSNGSISDVLVVLSNGGAEVAVDEITKAD